MLTLRPYQQDAVEKIIASINSTLTHPILVTASCGAGKSLIISTILHHFSNYKILCLTMNSELIRNNAKTFGEDAGIYCAGLDRKDFQQRVIFASPHSVSRRDKPLSECQFNLIVIDEAHNIPLENNSMYQRIFNHYGLMAQSERYYFRIIGLTGTPYRDGAISIIGEHAFFKEEVVNISMSQLIDQGYLIKPSFGFNKDEFNFNKLSEQDAVDEKPRLTASIMSEIVSLNRAGTFIFASTIKHCHECLATLPSHESAIIVGSTPQKERMRIIDGARTGIIKYLVSVNCLTVGIDIPNYDTVAWLRSTESLIIFTQGICRSIRLSPGKSHALVLDYAQNLQRHGDIDDPLINEAIKPRPETEQQFVIPCYTCNTLNTPFARRCIGTHNNERCNHFFEFKDCLKCNAKNDKTSRYCRECDYELIDPNTKLHRLEGELIAAVLGANYAITPSSFTMNYDTDHGTISEFYYTNSPQGKNIFYAQFVKKCVDKPSKYYMHLNNPGMLHMMVKFMKMPRYLTVSEITRKIKTKVF